MSTLTNDLARFTVVNVDPDAPARGPFIVSQLGSDPEDPRLQDCIHLLTRGGQWVKWASALTVPGGMAQELLFESAREMVEVLESLTGRAKILRLDVDPRESLAKIEEIEAAGGLRVALRFFLEERKKTRAD